MGQGIRTIALATAIDSENPVIGDLRLVDGDFSWLESDDINATDQAIARRLKAIQGEIFSDQRRGTPWFALLGKRGQLPRLRSMLRQVIQGTPGVKSCDLVDYSVDGATRVATVSWAATFDNGRRYTSADFEVPFIVEIGT